MTVITTTYQDAETKSVDVDGTSFAYRELGPEGGTPVVLLNHLAAVLDNWDPRVVDGLATKHRVITFDNRGVGASEGKTPNSIEAMATDAIAFIKALGHDQVDLLGFSMGGFVAQVIAQREPHLVRKLILTGTGPAGGVGIDRVTALTILDILKGALTRRDAKYYLFFTGTPNGRSEARKFLERLKERTDDRDKAISPGSFRAHLKAISAWADQEPADLSAIHHPTFVANGDHDRMVPTSNSRDLSRRLPNARLTIYPDAGHGGVFQHHSAFVAETLTFLGTSNGTPR
jgi:pimeloyl-ACP methyl ester carboxylesterase